MLLQVEIVDEEWMKDSNDPEAEEGSGIAENCSSSDEDALVIDESRTDDENNNNEAGRYECDKCNTSFANKVSNFKFQFKK